MPQQKRWRLRGMSGQPPRRPDRAGPPKTNPTSMRQTRDGVEPGHGAGVEDFRNDVTF